MKKELIFCFLFLMAVSASAQEVIFVDAVKNCLGPNGGEYYPVKVKKGATYELSIQDGTAIFNTHDNAEMATVGVMYVGVNRKMIIGTIEKGKKTAVKTQGDIYLFFVDDALLNKGGMNILIKEMKK
jgi:hypothetical protein